MKFCSLGIVNLATVEREAVFHVNVCSIRTLAFCSKVSTLCKSFYESSLTDFKIEMTSVVKSRLERALNFQGKQAGLDFAWSKKLDKQIILKNLKFKTEEISVPVNEKVYLEYLFHSPT